MRTTIKPIDKTNLAARVYAEMRESLIAGRFMPGERIRISETAQLFGTSDTPVREALLRLVSEHALEMQTAKQIAVPSLSLVRYSEIRTVRIALESAAVEVACANVTPKDITDLLRINKRFATAEAAHHPENHLRYNREFHYGVYNLCRLPTLLSMIENMWASMGPILRAFYEKSDRSYDQGYGQHDDLLDALSRKDADAATKAIRADLMTAAPSIERFLKEHAASVQTEAEATI